MSNNYFTKLADIKKEKRGMQSRKAVSEVVATILIVLFVVVALIIISVFLFQYIKRQSQGITSQCIDTRISITKAEFNSTMNITTLYLKRTAGNSNISRIRFIFDGEEKELGAGSDNSSLKLLETGMYIFSTEEKPKKIEIAPVIKGKDDKEMECGVNTIIFEKDIVEKIVSQQQTQTPSQSCTDDTAYGQCSANKPLFCSNGNLISNCTACSCPSGQQCQTNGTCQQQTQMQICFDSTNLSSCSLTKPLFCSLINGNLTLTSNCSSCGCDSGYYCGTGGQCMLQRCPDSTIYGQCSATKPLFCNNGTLASNCSSCSCPLGEQCQPDGSCQLLTCSDGTLNGECSSTKPQFCSNGSLVNNCASCGCNANYDCQPSGNCQLQTCSDGTAYNSCSAAKPLFCNNGALVNKCSACSCPSGEQCQPDESCNIQTQTLVIQPGAEGKDAYANTRGAPWNYGNGLYLYIGQYPPSSAQGLVIYRTYIEFSLSQLPANAKIVSAELQLYMTEGWNSLLDAEAYQVASAWTETGVTWNNQPSISSLITNTIIDPNGGGNNRWISWNITSLVNGWHNGTIQNYGIMLKGKDEGGTQGNWWSFKSSDFSASDSETWPKLVIQYV